MSVVNHVNHVDNLSCFENAASITLEFLKGQLQAGDASRVVGVNYCERKKFTYTREGLSSKPLFYAEAGDKVWISHNIGSLRRQAHLNKLNHQWLVRYFSFQESFTTDTPFLGIHSLPSNSTLEIGAKGVKIQRANKRKCLETLNWTATDWVIQWQEALEKAVSSACIGQGDVALMLSSGIDSAGIAAHLSKQNISQRAFSWRFPNHPEADESIYILELTKFLGIDVEFIDIENAECFDNLETWPVAPEAPYLNAMRRIKEKLYERVSDSECQVLLNGHIGDELAYVDRYYYSELWNDRPIDCIKELVKHIGGHGLSAKNHIAIRYWLKKRLRINDEIMPPSNNLSAYSRDLLMKGEQAESTMYRGEQYSMLQANSELDAIVSESFFTDKFGIERRHPYLNTELINLALACPAYLLSKPEQTKYLARQALKEMLPKALIQRQRVGQLDVLFEEGLNRNQAHIREYLFRSQRTWSYFVKESAVSYVLDNQLWDKAASILVPCIGLERWLDYWQQLNLPVDI